MDDKLVAIKNKSKIDALGTKLLTTFVMEDMMLRMFLHDNFT